MGVLDEGGDFEVFRVWVGGFEKYGDVLDAGVSGFEHQLVSVACVLGEYLGYADWGVGDGGVDEAVGAGAAAWVF